MYANDVYEIVRLLWESLTLYKYNQDALRPILKPFLPLLQNTDNIIVI